MVSVSTGIKVFVKTLSCASFAMKRLKPAVMQIFVRGQITGIGMTMPEKFLFQRTPDIKTNESIGKKETYKKDAK